MSRYDWPDRGDPRRDEDRRAQERSRDRFRDDDPEDFGLADYSSDYAYDPDARTGYRADERMAEGREDYGQADYSSDWAFDRERGRAREMRSGPDGRYREVRDERHDREPRSWMDRASDFLSGDTRGAPRRRRGPSDRVLWAVIVERLKEQRGLDLSDVEVFVDNCEVTLNGTVRRKDDKRRIEDVADVDGVRHVQNNLRVRDRGHWTFL